MSSGNPQGMAPLSRLHTVAMVSAGEGVLILIISAIAWAAHWPFIFASLGPTAYEQVELPRRRSARPYNIIAGHFVALGVSFLMIWAFGAWHTPNIFVLGSVSFRRLWAAAAAAALTAGINQALSASQPAALSTSLLVTLGLMQTGRDAIAIIVGVLILAAVGEPIRRFRAKYPPLAKKPAVVD